MAQKAKIPNRVVIALIVLAVAFVSYGYKGFDPWTVHVWTDNVPRETMPDNKSDTTPAYPAYTQGKNAYYSKVAFYWKADYNIKPDPDPETIRIILLARPVAANETTWLHMDTVIGELTDDTLHILDTMRTVPAEHIRLMCKETWSVEEASLMSNHVSIILLDAEE
jgi:hypothetical protein